MELTVRVININYGYNRELMEKCQPLCDYAYFVAAIRRNLNKLSMEQAIKASVEECIEKDILREFLLEQKAEVIAMSIYEYNEEYVRKDFYEGGVQEGYGRGMQEGKTIEMIAFIRKMHARNIKVEEIADYTEKSPKEIQLILELIEANPEADNQQIASMLKRAMEKKEY